MTVFIDDREQSRVAPAYQYYKEDMGLQKADLLKVNGVGEKTADTILLQLHDEFYE